MYGDRISFDADFKEAYPKDLGRIGTGWSIYQNSKNSDLKSLVIGRIERTENGALIRGLGDLERTNFGKTNEGSSGSVLSSNEWSIAMNDCWLLGAVHER